MPVLALTRPPVPLIHYTSPSPIHSTSAYSASSHPTLTPELRAHLIKSNKKVEQVLGVTPHLVSRPISSKSKSCDTPRPLPIGKASEEQGKEGKGAHKRTKSDECRKEGGMRKRRHTLFGSKSSSSSSDDSAVPPVPPMPSLPAVLNIGSNANASSSTTSLLRIESTTSSNTSSSSSTPPSSAGAGDILRQPPPRRSSHRHRPPPLNLKENTQPAPSSHVRSASSPVPVSASKEKDGALSPPLSSSLPNSPFLPSTPLSPAPENVISDHQRRLTKLARLQRRFGENVPLDLVFAKDTTNPSSKRYSYGLPPLAPPTLPLPALPSQDGRTSSSRTSNESRSRSSSDRRDRSRDASRSVERSRERNAAEGVEIQWKGVVTTVDDSTRRRKVMNALRELKA